MKKKLVLYVLIILVILILIVVFSYKKAINNDIKNINWSWLLVTNNLTWENLTWEDTFLSWNDIISDLPEIDWNSGFGLYLERQKSTISWFGRTHCNLSNSIQYLISSGLLISNPDSREVNMKNFPYFNIRCNNELFNIKVSWTTGSVNFDIYKDGHLLIKEFPAYSYCGWDMCPWVFSYNNIKWLLYWKKWAWDICYSNHQYFLYDTKNKDYKLKFISFYDASWVLSWHGWTSEITEISNITWKVNLNLSFLENKSLDAFSFNVTYNWLNVLYTDKYNTSLQVINNYKPSREIKFSGDLDCSVAFLNNLDLVSINTDNDTIELVAKYQKKVMTPSEHGYVTSLIDESYLNVIFNINDLSKPVAVEEK